MWRPSGPASSKSSPQGLLPRVSCGWSLVHQKLTESPAHAGPLGKASAHDGRGHHALSGLRTWGSVLSTAGKCAGGASCGDPTSQTLGVSSSKRILVTHWRGKNGQLCGRAWCDSSGPLPSEADCANCTPSPVQNQQHRGRAYTPIGSMWPSGPQTRCGGQGRCVHSRRAWPGMGRALDWACRYLGGQMEGG